MLPERLERVSGRSAGAGQSPLVSAVIPAFNAERYLREAIDSVLGQTYPHIECVVVDDGSTDRTASLLDDYGQRVRVARQTNQGVAAARNAGARTAQGSLLAFLDADDIWLAQHVERQWAALSAGPGGDAVVSAAALVEGDQRRPLDRTLRVGAPLDVRSMLLGEVELASVSSNMLITADRFRALGGFDSRLSTAADWEFLLRLAGNGRVRGMDEVLTLYRIHDANMSHSVELMERDMLLVYGEMLGDSCTDPRLHQIRNRAYANLHRMLAGSYLSQGRTWAAVRHALRAARSHPAAIGYFLRAPVRRLGRKPA